jgi:mycothiol synthase
VRGGQRDRCAGVSREDWEANWAADPMFLAVYDGEVIGCAGLDRDPPRPS